MGALFSVALLMSAASLPLAEPAAEIVWIDLAGTPAGATGVAREEADRLLSQLGLTVRWRTGAPADVLEQGELAVVLLPRDKAAQRGSFILGACNSRSSTPRAWVFLSSLQWALGLPSLSGPSHSNGLGVALGRIVAHEVVHALAPGVEHARWGLMSPRLDRIALLSPGMGIDPTTRRALGAMGSRVVALRDSSPDPTH